jgi:hypothetical protein
MVAAGSLSMWSAPQSPCLSSTRADTKQQLEKAENGQHKEERCRDEGIHAMCVSLRPMAPLTGNLPFGPKEG